MAERAGRRVALGPGAEFDLIRRALAGAPPLLPEVLVGPGDDAALFEGGWAVTTDMSVEDVHFRRAWLAPREIGYRAGAAALSDLAAVAARPVALLLSLAAPAGEASTLEEVHAGLREAAERAGACVAGGDVSGSPGPLVIDVVALGRASRPLLRDGARPGDEVWVTGRLGGAAGAVHAWEEGREPPAALRRAFARPDPRIEEALHFAGNAGVHALIDLSDGLAGDAGHLAAASGAKIVLEEARVPLDEGAVAAHGPARALELALHGGEDYELLVACVPGAVLPGTFAGVGGPPLTRVGRVEAGEGVWLERADGTLTRLARGGFDHFSSAR